MNKQHRSSHRAVLVFKQWRPSALVVATVLAVAANGLAQPMASASTVAAARPVVSGAAARMAQAESIHGMVFRDYNGNGVMDTGSVTHSLAVDAGVAGVTIAAYISGTVPVASAQTDAGGAYTLTGLITGAGYRVELTGAPAAMFPTARAAASGSAPANGTTVQFVTAGDTNVSFGINEPCEYCQSGASVAVVSQRQFNDSNLPEAIGIVTADSGLVSRSPFPDAGLAALVDADKPLRRVITTSNETVGTLYGLAYDRTAKRIFSSAYFKRYLPLGVLGTGGIYVSNPSTGAAAPFADLNAIFGPLTAGPDFHGAGGDPRSDYAVFSGFAFTNTFDAVGKTGLGDIDVSDDGASLFVMNLFDRSVYVLPTTLGPLLDATHASQIVSYTVPVAALPSRVPGEPCPASDVRPFGMKYFRGKLYVGAVCSGESRPASGDAFDVASSTDRDGTFNTNSDTFTDGNGDGVFTWQDDENLMAYVLRMDPATGVFENAPVIAQPLDFRDSRYQDRALHSWSRVPRGYNNDGTRRSYAQPMLADIDFDAGNMILGIRDRFGDQTALATWFLEGNGAPASMDYMGDSRVHGQVLRACGSPELGWTMESNGVCGDGRGIDTTWENVAPGGYRFYHDESGDRSPFASVGGLAVYPGVAMLNTVLDPAGQTNHGIRWYRNTDGEIIRSYNFYPNLPRVGAAEPVAGKGNGMGDLEVLCDAAPIEIGNRVWLDSNNNGIQDPGEPPLSGITVTLSLADGATATAVTDGAGEYYFTDKPLPIDTGASAVFVPTLARAGAFTLTVDSTQMNLRGYRAARANADGQSNNDAFGDVRDSDAIADGIPVRITGTIAGPGASNHGIDFGFVPAPVPTLTKTALAAGAVQPGQRIEYRIVVGNQGAAVASGVVVSDLVPAGVTYIEGSASPSATLTGGQVVWPARDIAPGAVLTLTLAFTVNGTTPGQVTINNVAQLYMPLGGSIVSSNQTVTPLSPTAITLDRFEAQSGAGGVLVRWRTSLEQNVFGFYLLRSSSNSVGGAVRVNSDMIAARGSALGASYEFDDAAGSGGNYYWLEEIELDGARIVHGPVLATALTVVGIGGVALKPQPAASAAAQVLDERVAHRVAGSAAPDLSAVAAGSPLLPQAVPALVTQPVAAGAAPEPAIERFMRAELPAQARALADLTAHARQPSTIADKRALNHAQAAAALSQAGGTLAQAQDGVVAGAHGNGILVARGQTEPVMRQAPAQAQAVMDSKASTFAETALALAHGAVIVLFALGGIVGMRRRRSGVR